MLQIDTDALARAVYIKCDLNINCFQIRTGNLKYLIRVSKITLKISLSLKQNRDDVLGIKKNIFFIL